jgi:hypothetical protein
VCKVVVLWRLHSLWFIVCHRTICVSVLPLRLSQPTTHFYACFVTISRLTDPKGYIDDTHKWWSLFFSTINPLPRDFQLQSLGNKKTKKRYSFIFLFNSNKNIYTYPYNKIIKNEYKVRDKSDLKKNRAGTLNQNGQIFLINT